MLAVVDPGDEVIIFKPCWPTLPSQVLLAGAKPVFVDVKGPTYIPTTESVRAAVTPKTKAIILNSPNNPTGAVYDRAALQAIGDLAIGYQLWIISDECYSSFVFNGHPHESIVTAHPGIRSRTVLVNAFSKELAITGWRLGYFAAPPDIVSAAKKLQSHTTSNANVIAQHAILHHLKVTDGVFEKGMFERLSRARTAILARLADVPVPQAEGSFFFISTLANCWPSCQPGRRSKPSMTSPDSCLRKPVSPQSLVRPSEIRPVCAFPSARHPNCCYRLSKSWLAHSTH